jgi:hypothetical protein
VHDLHMRARSARVLFDRAGGERSSVPAQTVSGQTIIAGRVFAPLRSRADSIRFVK